MQNERITALEKEVADLKRQLEERPEIMINALIEACEQLKARYQCHV